MICKLIFCNGKQLARMICLMNLVFGIGSNTAFEIMLFRTPKRNKRPRSEASQIFLQNAYEEAAKSTKKTLA